MIARCAVTGQTTGCKLTPSALAAACTCALVRASSIITSSLPCLAFITYIVTHCSVSLREWDVVKSWGSTVEPLGNKGLNFISLLAGCNY